MEFSAEKSFEKSLFQEIPRNFPRKVIFRRKNVRKIGPRWVCEKVAQELAQPIYFGHVFKEHFRLAQRFIKI
jgi:hypothetical protein